MSGPRVMNITQFATERGLVTTHHVQSHIHAGLRSAPTTKSYERRNKAELLRLQNARDETVRLFREAVEAGEIIDADTLVTTEMRAQGHPDNPTTQAAIRLLAKRAARNAQ